MLLIYLSECLNFNKTILLVRLSFFFMQPTFTNNEPSKLSTDYLI